MIWFQRKKFIFKILACLIVIQFIGAHAVWAQEGGKIVAPVVPAAMAGPTPDEIISLYVPEAYGDVKKATLGTEDKVIIHIQDSHVNYEAQTNIIKILTHLVGELSQKNNGNGPGCLIAVEGAAGPSDPGWFRLFPNKEVKESVLDYFLRRGFISGPQYFQVFAEQAVPVVGVEEAELYRENLAAFRETYAHSEEVMGAIAELERGMNLIRDKLYNDELRQFSEKSAAFHSNKLVLTDYVTYLSAVAQAKGVDLAAFGQITATLEAIAADKAIDYDQVNKERTRLVDKLQSRLTREDVSELVSNSLYFRLGKMSSLQYYTFLEELARDNGIEIEEYPQMEKYLEALNLHSQIEPELLFQEIGRAEKKIKESLFQTKEERECNRQLRNLYLLRNLCKLEMTREELQEYRDNRDQFLIEEFLFFIEDQSSLFNLDLRIDPKVDRINGYFLAMEKFYQAALARDEALAQRTLEAMDQAKVKTAIVVTGGFHTEGLVRKFEGENLSTMVVSPRITQDVGNAAYLDVMLNEIMPLERVLARKGNRLSQPLRMFVDVTIVGADAERDQLHDQLVLIYRATMLLKDSQAKDLKAFQELLQKQIENLPADQQTAAKSIFDRIEVLSVSEEKRNDGLYVKFRYGDKILYVAVANRESTEKLGGTMRLFFESTGEQGVVGTSVFAIQMEEVAEGILKEIERVRVEAPALRRAEERVIPAAEAPAQKVQAALRSLWANKREREAQAAARIPVAPAAPAVEAPAPIAEASAVAFWATLGVGPVTDEVTRQYGLFIEPAKVQVSLTPENRLGGGLQAEIYKGTWNGKDVAVKILRESENAEENAKNVNLFKREASKLTQLPNVPGVVKYYGMTLVNGKPALVLEKVEASPLRNTKKGKFTNIFAVKPELFDQLKNAISEVHNRGVTHGDLHGENVLVRADGTPVLIDWAGALEPRVDESKQDLTDVEKLQEEFALAANVQIKGQITKGQPWWVEAAAFVIQYANTYDERKRTDGKTRKDILTKGGKESVTILSSPQNREVILQSLRDGNKYSILYFWDQIRNNKITDAQFKEAVRSAIAEGSAKSRDKEIEKISRAIKAAPTAAPVLGPAAAPALGKGALEPIFTLAKYFNPEKSDPEIEDKVVPFYEEVIRGGIFIAGTMLAAFLFPNFGFVIAFLLNLTIESVFVGLHPYLGRAPPLGKELTAFQKLNIPLKVAAVAFSINTLAILADFLLFGALTPGVMMIALAGLYFRVFVHQKLNLAQTLRLQNEVQEKVNEFAKQQQAIMGQKEKIGNEETIKEIAKLYRTVNAEYNTLLERGFPRNFLNPLIDLRNKIENQYRSLDREIEASKPKEIPSAAPAVAPVEVPALQMKFQLQTVEGVTEVPFSEFLASLERKMKRGTKSDIDNARRLLDDLFERNQLLEKIKSREIVPLKGYLLLKELLDKVRDTPLADFQQRVEKTINEIMYSENEISQLQSNPVPQNDLTSQLRKNSAASWFKKFGPKLRDELKKNKKPSNNEAILNRLMTREEQFRESAEITKDADGGVRGVIRQADDPDKIYPIRGLTEVDYEIYLDWVKTEGFLSYEQRPLYRESINKTYLAPLLRNPSLKKYITTFNFHPPKPFYGGELGSYDFNQEKQIGTVSFFEDFMAATGRRNYGLIFIHEQGHALEQAIRDGILGPEVKEKLEKNHKFLDSQSAFYAMDFGLGQDYRRSYQFHYKEFIAETFTAYVTQNESLRAHVEQVRAQNPDAGSAWDEVLAIFDSVLKPREEAEAQAAAPAPLGTLAALWGKLGLRPEMAMWVAGLEELLFGGLLVSGLSLLLTPVLGAPIALAATSALSAFLFPLAHMTGVYRASEGMLQRAPPTPRDLASLLGLGIVLRALYLAPLLLTSNFMAVPVALLLAGAWHYRHNVGVLAELARARQAQEDERRRQEAERLGLGKLMAATTQAQAPADIGEDIQSFVEGKRLILQLAAMRDTTRAPPANENEKEMWDAATTAIQIQLVAYLQLSDTEKNQITTFLFHLANKDLQNQIDKFIYHALLLEAPALLANEKSAIYRYLATLLYPELALSKISRSALSSAVQKIELKVGIPLTPLDEKIMSLAKAPPAAPAPAEKTPAVETIDISDVVLDIENEKILRGIQDEISAIDKEYGDDTFIQVLLSGAVKIENQKKPLEMEITTEKFILEAGKRLRHEKKKSTEWNSSMGDSQRLEALKNLLYRELKNLRFDKAGKYRDYLTLFRIIRRIESNNGDRFFDTKIPYSKKIGATPAELPGAAREEKRGDNYNAVEAKLLDDLEKNPNETRLYIFMGKERIGKTETSKKFEKAAGATLKDPNKVRRIEEDKDLPARKTYWERVEDHLRLLLEGMEKGQNVFVLDIISDEHILNDLQKLLDKIDIEKALPELKTRELQYLYQEGQFIEHYPKIKKLKSLLAKGPDGKMAQVKRVRVNLPDLLRGFLMVDAIREGQEVDKNRKILEDAEGGQRLRHFYLDNYFEENPVDFEMDGLTVGIMARLALANPQLVEGRDKNEEFVDYVEQKLTEKNETEILEAIKAGAPYVIRYFGEQVLDKVKGKELLSPFYQKVLAALWESMKPRIEKGIRIPYEIGWVTKLQAALERKPATEITPGEAAVLAEIVEAQPPLGKGVLVPLMDLLTLGQFSHLLRRMFTQDQIENVVMPILETGFVGAAVVGLSTYFGFSVGAAYLLVGLVFVGLHPLQYLILRLLGRAPPALQRATFLEFLRSTITIPGLITIAPLTVFAVFPSLASLLLLSSPPLWVYALLFGVGLAVHIAGNVYVTKHPELGLQKAVLDWLFRGRKELKAPPTPTLVPTPAPAPAVPLTAVQKARQKAQEEREAHNARVEKIVDGLFANFTARGFRSKSIDDDSLKKNLAQTLKIHGWKFEGPDSSLEKMVRKYIGADFVNDYEQERVQYEVDKKQTGAALENSMLEVILEHLELAIKVETGKLEEINSEKFLSSRPNFYRIYGNFRNEPFNNQQILPRTVRFGSEEEARADLNTMAILEVYSQDVGKRGERKFAVVAYQGKKFLLYRSASHELWRRVELMTMLEIAFRREGPNVVPVTAPHFLKPMAENALDLNPDLSSKLDSQMAQMEVQPTDLTDLVNFIDTMKRINDSMREEDRFYFDNETTLTQNGEKLKPEELDEFLDRYDSYNRFKMYRDSPEDRKSWFVARLRAALAREAAAEKLAERVQEKRPAIQLKDETKTKETFEAITVGDIFRIGTFYYEVLEFSKSEILLLQVPAEFRNGEFYPQKEKAALLSLSLSPQHPITIGKALNNTVVQPDSKASGNHASLSIEKRKIVLTDLKSTNGTFIYRQPTEDLLAIDFDLGKAEPQKREVTPAPAPAPTPTPAAAPTPTPPAKVVPAVTPPVTLPAPAVPVAQVGGVTAPNKRKGRGNQDSYLAETLPNGLQVVGVFDGMGGRAAGDIASQTVRDFLREELSKISAEASEEAIRKLVQKALGRANVALLKRASEDRALEGMDTTATFAVVFLDASGKRKAIVAHAGDSRAYLYSARKNELLQITQDDNQIHKFAEQWHSQGYLSEEQRDRLIRAESIEEIRQVFEELHQVPDKYEPIREDLSAYYKEYKRHIKEEAVRAHPAEALFRLENVVTASAASRVSQIEGEEARTAVRTITVKLSEGDQLLFTTDGAHKNQTRQQIAAILRANPSAQEAAQTIVAAAQEVGRVDDDTTAVVMTISAAAAPTLRPPENPIIRHIADLVGAGAPYLQRGELLPPNIFNEIYQQLSSLGEAALSEVDIRWYEAGRGILTTHSTLYWLRNVEALLQYMRDNSDAYEADQMTPLPRYFFEGARALLSTTQENITDENFELVMAQVRRSPETRKIYYDQLKDRSTRSDKQERVLNLILDVARGSNEKFDISIFTDWETRRRKAADEKDTYLGSIQFEEKDRLLPRKRRVLHVGDLFKMGDAVFQIEQITAESIVFYSTKEVYVGGIARGQKYFTILRSNLKAGNVITLGRETENMIQVVDAKVSRKHAHIRFSDGKFILEDLGSSNGTYYKPQPTLAPATAMKKLGRRLAPNQDEGKIISFSLEQEDAFIELAKKAEQARKKEEYPLPGTEKAAIVVYATNRQIKGLAAQHFKRGDQVYIVINESMEKRIQEEGKYHEAREAYWIEKIRKLVADGKLDLSRFRIDGWEVTVEQAAHMMASADQILKYSSKDQLTPYHQQQIKEMKTTDLEEFLAEDRTVHHAVLETILGLVRAEEGKRVGQTPTQIEENVQTEVGLVVAYEEKVLRQKVREKVGRQEPGFWQRRWNQVLNYFGYGPTPTEALLQQALLGGREIPPMGRGATFAAALQPLDESDRRDLTSQVVVRLRGLREDLEAGRGDPARQQEELSVALSFFRALRKVDRGLYEQFLGARYFAEVSFAALALHERQFARERKARVQQAVSYAERVLMATHIEAVKQPGAFATGQEQLEWILGGVRALLSKGLLKMEPRFKWITGARNYMRTMAAFYQLHGNLMATTDKPIGEMLVRQGELEEAQRQAEEALNALPTEFVSDPTKATLRNMLQLAMNQANIHVVTSSVGAEAPAAAAVPAPAPAPPAVAKPAPVPAPTAPPAATAAPRRAPAAAPRVTPTPPEIAAFERALEDVRGEKEINPFLRNLILRKVEEAEPNPLKSYAELFWKDRQEGRKPTVNEKLYLEIYATILKRNPEVLLAHLRLYVAEFELDRATDLLYQTALRQYQESISGDTARQIALFQVERLPEARSQYYNQLAAKERTADEDIVFKRALEIAEAVKTQSDRAILTEEQARARAPEAPPAAPAAPPAAPRVREPVPVGAPVPAVTPLPVAPPTRPKYWVATPPRGAPAPTPAPAAVAPVAEAPSQLAQERKIRAEENEDVQELLSKIFQVDKETSPEEPDLLPNLAIGDLNLGFEGDLANRMDRINFYKKAIQTGYPLALNILLLALNSNQVPAQLRDLFVSLQNRVRDQADVLKDFTDKGNLIPTRTKDGELVLVIDVEQIYLTTNGTLDEKKIHPDLMHLLEGNASKMKVILFSTTPGRNFMPVLNALPGLKGRVATVSPSRDLSQVPEQDRQAAVNELLGQIDQMASFLTERKAKDLIFITTPEHHRDFFQPVLAQFLLYLVFDSKEKTYYVDDSLREAYRGATGGAIPAKLKFVPRMRYDSNAIDEFKRREAAEKAA